jgi:hypothetical protein
MSELEQRLTAWATLDKRISKLNNDIKILKDKRTQVGDILTVSLKDSDIENSNFEFPHLERRIILSEKTSQEGITYKYLEECFNDYFHGDHQKTGELINVVKTKRKKTSKSVLRGEDL